MQRRWEELKVPYTELGTTTPSSYIMPRNWSTQVSGSVIEGGGRRYHTIKREGLDDISTLSVYWTIASPSTLKSV